MSFKFERKVNYYETDKMGVVHHSNYIRFMEEARCAWLEELGMPMALLEKEGVTIPTLGLNCEYKYHVTAGDIVVINAYVKEYTSVRMKIEYEITEKETGKLVLIGETKHCFTDINLKPISLKKYKPEFNEKFLSLLEN